MKKNFKLKSIPRAALLFVVLTFASQCFAQSSIESDTKISSFQYMKKLNSVFDFVQLNYVDDLDAKLLYEGALKGMLEAIGEHLVELVLQFLSLQKISPISLPM